MTIILIISVIIVLVVLLLAVITTSKAYTYKHSIDPDSNVSSFDEEKKDSQE